MNENTSKIHLEILDSERQKVFSKLQPILDNFTLGGGTAIALQIQHRQSYDFDFFSKQPIPKNLLEKISLLGFASVSPTLDTRDELSLIIDNKIKVTFLFYPFSKVFELNFLDKNIRFFSLSGLAAQKAYIVGRRGVWRDYYDIFSLLSRKYFSLEEIINLAKKNYGDIFSTKLFLSQLVYFQDIQDFGIEPINDGLPIATSDEIKVFLEKEVKKYLKISGLL